MLAQRLIISEQNIGLSSYESRTTVAKLGPAINLFAGGASYKAAARQRGESRGIARLVLFMKTLNLKRNHRVSNIRA